MISIPGLAVADFDVAEVFQITKEQKTDEELPKPQIPQTGEASV